MWSQARNGICRPLLSNLRSALAALSLAVAALLPTFAQAGVLQCVPYARQISGIDISGNARTWWSQAAGTYARGHEPKVGAVLAFKASGAMPYGHVATVAKVIDERHVLLNHANWSRPGMIERQAMAVDVSDGGDWSEVRVWYAPTASLGTRVNPAFGFIYDAPAGTAPETLGDETQLASADEGAVPAVASGRASGASLRLAAADR